MAIDLFTIGRFTIHGYGLMIGIGFLAAVLVGCYRAKRYGLSDDHLINIALLGLVAGFLGSKILFVIVEFRTFLEDPLEVLGSEGFVVYGGIIGGTLAMYLYCRIRKLKFLSYFDIVTPSVALNQAFGRIGCFLAGCCYGKETHSVFGVIFPSGCLAPSGVKLIPTQLLSSGGDFLLAIGLMIYARRAKYRGNVSAFYLLFYSVGRFMVEIFRGDDRGTVGFLSTSQFIAVLMFLFALAFLFYNKKRGFEAEKYTPGKVQPKDEDPKKEA